MKRNTRYHITRWFAAVFALLIAVTTAGCALFGDDDDSTEGAGAAGTGAAYGYMVFNYFGASGAGYQTNLTLTADEGSSDPFLFMELYDNTADADIETGSYQVVADASADGAAAPGNVLVLQITRGAAVTREGDTVRELRFDYVGANLSRAGFESLYTEVQTLTTGEYQRITGGTVTVAESAGRYTLSWTLATEDGGSIVGSYEGAVDREIDSSFP